MLCQTGNLCQDSGFTTITRAGNYCRTKNMQADQVTLKGKMYAKNTQFDLVPCIFVCLFRIMLPYFSQNLTKMEKVCLFISTTIHPIKFILGGCIAEEPRKCSVECKILWMSSSLESCKKQHWRPSNWPSEGTGQFCQMWNLHVLLCSKVLIGFAFKGQIQIKMYFLPRNQYVVYILSEVFLDQKRC